MRLGHDMGAPADACRARRWITGSPSAGTTRRRDEGLPGYWAILFVRAACQAPRRVRHPLALTMVTLLPSGWKTPWAPRIRLFRGRTPRLTRSRAYASPASFPSPSQGSLPTGWLGLQGALAPQSDGFRTRWMTYRISFDYRIVQLLSDQHGLVAVSTNPQPATLQEQQGTELTR